MKIKYSFFLTILSFLFLNIQNAHSDMYFTSNYYANMAFSPNYFGKSKAGIYGLFKHSLHGDKVSFHLDTKMGNIDNIYNLANINIIFLFIAPYITYTNNTNTFSIGFIPVIGSETYINENQSKSQSFLGPQLINSIISPNIFNNRYYMVNNTFLHNDYSFGISYVKSFFYDTLQLGVNYSPDYNLKLSIRDFSPYYINNQAIDFAAVYYNEYNSIGYGFNASLRYLMPLSNTNISKLEKDFDTKTHDTYELSLGLDIDYMGFSYRLGYGKGSNYLQGNSNSSPSKISYYVTKNSLSYSLDKYKIAGSYSFSKVSNLAESYRTKLLEIETVYNASRYLGLKVSFYKTWLNNKTSNGILFGITVNI